MHLRVALLAATLALALPPGAARAEPAGCTGTLSGAFTATFKCSVTVRDVGDGTAVIDVRQTEKVEGIGAFGVGAWIIPGKPAKGRYPFDALGLGKSSVIIEKDGALFSATRTTLQARGEVALELTAVTPLASPAGAYAVHGSFSARLLPIGNLRKEEIAVAVKF
jgi:hypothetical protein